MTDIELKIVSIQSSFESKRIHNFKTQIRDKFRLQKLGVTKVLFDFDFGYFWRYWLQRHLVGKVL